MKISEYGTTILRECRQTFRDVPPALRDVRPTRSGWSIHEVLGHLIDSANNNLLVGNTGSGNAVYDCELTGDTFRFGFLTPAAYENSVFISDPSYTVKDCGNDNTVLGGDQVDITADPCF